MKWFYKREGFTLLELIVVIIIIGILATIMTPHFFNMMEKARAAEATSSLGTIRRAQLRYAEEHGVTTANLPDLDVSFKTLRFYILQAEAPIDPETAVYPNNIVARITRNNINNPGFGNYILGIGADGTIDCADDALAPGSCTMLGY